MRIASAVSLKPNAAAAASEVASAVASGLSGERADIAFLFVSRHHVRKVEEVASAVQRELGARHLAGCSADSVLGGAEEHLDRPAMSLWAAALPAAHVGPVTLESPSGEGSGWSGDSFSAIRSDARTLVVLADPFTFDADGFVRAAAAARPGLQIVGGMASSAQSPGGNRLVLDGEVLDEGAVGVAFSGEVEVRSVVSQGCRPFGRPLVVTRCEDHIVYELGGRPALEKFSEQVVTLSAKDRQALTRGLHIGRAVDSARASDGRGEFLIRGVLGFAQENGAMVIGDHATRGQTVQFHLRDPDSASRELHRLLECAREEIDPPVEGALLFTCNGRGTRMFPSQNHDAGAVRRRFGEIPVAGFFAAGEIGPVGKESFLHGFTAVTALFTAARPESG
jgi:small ligand-binding sensory domain FIST